MSEVGEAALERALENRNLLLLYQPIHNVSDHAIVGAEALMRQRRASGEIREASIITETAEESSHDELFFLDSWLVRTACRDAALWQQRHPNVHLNVNLSPREFTEGKILNSLRTLVGEYRIDPTRVHLEITETSYIQQPKGRVGILEEAKQLGFELWLDDFGTEFSTLTHLQQFPVDGLKISGTFVAGVPTDRKATVITTALINLAHTLDLRVVAEEVEREDQLRYLREVKCDYVQGFLLSRPMPLEDFQKLLDAPSSSTPRAHRDRDAGRDRA